MSDPLTLTNIAEETPSGSVSRAASHPTLFNLDTPFSQHAEEPDYSRPPPVTPKLGGLRARSGSSVSRVDVEFFDPEGVEALRRTMTKETKDLGRPSAAPSSTALTDEPFDFEQTIRNVVRRYVSNFVPSNTKISYQIQTRRSTHHAAIHWSRLSKSPCCRTWRFRFISANTGVSA